ncbi:DUF2790 domain-containing protein [Pseudomonas guariconensis]|uniref:DUF2790 domain-containing protein n=1 Tax=Pseudomonas guariconensis TaxID=1288410 RepID=UPI0018ABF393|nr:DUF2790 domain-containing protein [Pseudomonas guariconensis]MBF8722880.1 DUF2790 domain-containing protein [Pseudomonas guariconensis]MBF8741527.1 DUF2790 domain-containing protein [Pseudomonas guariconensis]MBF8751168.1 DUF2790 domain-containing protein [Pseudomonas guariconensis]MBF8794011.1 DUF2790 domain-containing protein [Pseudomonas monteilii]
MTTSKAFAIATLTLGVSVGAFAQTATQYHYGMDLDIDTVISVEDTPSISGENSVATLTYRDSHGKEQKVSYILPNTAANQN